MKPSILILSTSNISNDPRVHKQITSLSAEYAVYVAGFGDPQIEGIIFCPIESISAKGFFEKIYKGILSFFGNYKPYLSLRYKMKNDSMVSTEKFSCIILNDIQAFYIAKKYSHGAPIIFDAHEYYPNESDSFLWVLFHKFSTIRMCKKIISSCSEMMTVSPTIAKKYEKYFGKHPILVMNLPYYHHIKPTKVEKKSIKLVHHGTASQERSLETMIEIMDMVDDRFTLDLFLTGGGKYREKLFKMVSKKSNINWKDPVPMKNLPQTLNAYDMGIYLLPPKTFNLAYCLPNKFFEFIQARLGIAIGPSPEMAEIVRQHNLGIVSDTFDSKSFAEKLNSLTMDDIIRFKKNSDAIAYNYSFEQNKKIIRDIVGKVSRKRMIEI